MTRFLVVVGVSVGMMVNVSSLQGQGSAPHGAGDAADWLARARAAVGIPRASGKVLHYRSVEGAEQNYQSDRTYPPFFSAFVTREAWLDPVTGVVRATSQTTFPGFAGRSELVSTEAASFAARDSALVPAPEAHLNSRTLRELDPWAVLLDWSRDPAIRVEGHRRVRDYDRLVLGREGRFGHERLLLDPKSGFPVVLERTERHYLWGQVSVVYLYSTWTLADGASYPGAIFRQVDGATEVTRTIANFALVPADSAPALRVPDAPSMPLALPLFLQPTNPDTVRVGANAVLLVNRGYTEAVVLERDTVFLFDATQGDERARQDSVWIGRLFPGRHPIVLVVTDLAWPHVAGVRFWVAAGATVVSHQISRPFLEQVVARRWTLEPDRLERMKQRPPLRFRAVSDSLSLAGGAISLYPIDGIASEGALMAFLRRDGFLWASDYVQTVKEPSRYGLEVYQAASRVGVEPSRLAAEHLPVTTWETLRKVVGAGGG
ncbi:MAG TPA: hypothetical protein VLD58_17500 [Gemmatimonadales bacterium]|nr:hypothetical protein [Gemmatimonadales bacterium]